MLLLVGLHIGEAIFRPACGRFQSHWEYGDSRSTLDGRLSIFRERFEGYYPNMNAGMMSISNSLSRNLALAQGL